jgi:hypothetical protein
MRKHADTSPQRIPAGVQKETKLKIKAPNLQKPNAPSLSTTRAPASVCPAVFDDMARIERTPTATGSVGI